ncbi:hypothetical protein CFBP498_21940 [Xanthomonas hortorum pv. vitians]|jgi:hypothetical protein|uniref:Uncharacterized protein n=1 Tax=Xanthomonas hortorum pv. vitians TaxID=83224 RepID=A0A6V7DB30_9XANT|nr:hypothetical protein CFBP498_21940 [Xanthomonas hortorum pv. vitians]CAD0331210.1 hypothetical protein CFBP498_21940 [Xanthomonas hortorum pv. vitians]
MVIIYVPPGCQWQRVSNAVIDDFILSNLVRGANV